MKILTLDFETFWDPPAYSLSKMTNEEYIRDPRFESLMVSLQMDKGEVFNVLAPDIKRVFAQIPWREIAVLCHHTHFDCAILSWVYDVHPAFILDTLSMFRALHPAEAASLDNMTKVLGLPPKGTEIGNSRGKHLKDFSNEGLMRFQSYCNNDVLRTREAFDLMVPYFPISELRLIDLTTRMFTEPILELDPELLAEAHYDEMQRKDELLSRVNADKKILGSNPLFAQLLVEQGIDPPKKISPAWQKKHPEEIIDRDDAPVGLLSEKEEAWAYAFAKSDEGMKLMLQSDSVVVQALAEARIGVKSTIRETRMQRMIGISKRGPLGVYLKYYSAHTGRYGGGDSLNLQNLTKFCQNEGCEGGKINEADR